MTENLAKSFLRRAVSPTQWATIVGIRKKLLRRFWAPFVARDLRRLATIHGTDKWGEHQFAEHYQEHFCKWRRKTISILEIGVGGYADPCRGGASLRMWKQYFPKAQVFAIDIHEKSPLEEKRIHIFRGSQNDPEFLKSVGSNAGPFDIIIDDGSHIVEHVLTSFETLLPFLNHGGYYAVEDIQTSYWPNCGGNSQDLGDQSTTMNFFKRLADGLNHAEFLLPDYIPSYYDKKIVALHFYHNLVIIRKGLNEEASTMVYRGTLAKEPAGEGHPEDP